ncbi:MAG: B12-binding domain-containing radical SAM protein [Spirochaetaceae bacterium]
MRRKAEFLMIYPEIPDTYWSFRYALGMVGKPALMPPLGLSTVASMVPPEYECRIVDMNVEPLRDTDIAEADLVLISAMIVQKESMETVIERCRALGVPVAAGGPYATSCSKEIKGVDHFILGEGEISFAEFLKDYASGNPKAVYRSDDKPDLSCTPLPRFDLLDLQKYHMIPIQFSRGCPFDCEFCDIVRLFGHKVRTKPPQRFIAELDAAYRAGFRGAVFVVDDNFIGNHKRTKELLQHLVAWQRRYDHPFSFSTEASIDLAYDRELLDLMVEAGFTMAFVGLESPVDESLEAAGKQQNRRRDMIESVRTIQRRGIEVTGGFIIGFDSDPPDVFERQIEFIEELAVPTAMVGLLTALPNTRLYERLIREGRLYAGSNGNNFSTGAMNFRPLLPEEDIARGYRRVLETIYSPRRYFNRCLRLLDQLPRSVRREHRSRRPRIKRRDAATALRSLVRQTCSRYGHYYLAFIARALLRRPDQIVRIFTSAIQGHHYMTVTRRSFHGASPRRTQRASRHEGVKPETRYRETAIAATMD